MNLYVPTYSRPSLFLERSILITYITVEIATEVCKCYKVQNLKTHGGTACGPVILEAEARDFTFEISPGYLDSLTESQ